MSNLIDGALSAIMRRSLRGSALSLLWAERKVQRQRLLLETLRQDGDATIIAEELLATYEHTYDRLRARLQIIEDDVELSEGDRTPPQAAE